MPEQAEEEAEGYYYEDVCLQVDYAGSIWFPSQMSVNRPYIECFGIIDHLAGWYIAI